MKNSPSYKHGHAPRGRRPSIYTHFMNVKSRCTIKSNKDYTRYGGRGITVCDRWLHGENGKTGFECFMEDMGCRPEGTSLGRINNDEGYSPTNCEWQSAEEQANNRRNSHFLTIDGETKTIAQWSRISGISTKAILHRLKHQKLSDKDAVFKPLMWTKKEINNEHQETI